MSTLDDLFPDGALRRGERVVLDDHHTTRRLSELLGDHRPELDVTHRASDRRSLVDMVKDAASNARSLASSAPAAAGTGRRPRRRIDLLNVGMATLAGGALVVAGLVGGVQAATANPSEEAVRVLKADEKTIASATAGLEASRTRFIEALAAADSEAEALQTAVNETRDAVDPAEIPEGEKDAPEGARKFAISDKAATDTLLGAIDAYRGELKGLGVPDLPAEYVAVKVDHGSLTSVASAIDAAQAQLLAIDQASGALRQLRVKLEASRATLYADAAMFAATFPASAKAVIDAHPDGAKERKDAVTTAAETLEHTELLGASGAGALTAYRDAVVELVAQQVRLERQWERERLEREREEREKAERERPRPQPSPTDPTSPPTEPTEPPANGDDTAG